MTIYKPGDAIVVNGRAIVHAVNHEKKGQYCDGCLKRSDDLLGKCGGCAYMYYCSKVCQTENWKDCHKYECKHFKKMIDNKTTLFTGSCMKMLCFRFCIKSRFDKDFVIKKWLLPDGIERTVEDLDDSQVKQNKSTDCGRMRSLVPLVIAQEILKLGIEIDPLIVEKRFRQVANNSGRIKDEFSYDCNESPAFGIFFERSMFNHSCQPNAVVVFDGPKLLIRAIEDIDTTVNEITLNYLYPTLCSTKERKKRIKVQSASNCICELCSNKNNFDKDRLKSERLMEEMITAYRDNKFKRANSKSNKVELIYRKYFGEFSFLLVNLFRSQLDLLGTKSDASNGTLQYYKQLLDKFKEQAFVIYSRDHPFTKQCLANYEADIGLKHSYDGLPPLMDLNIND